MPILVATRGSRWWTEGHARRAIANRLRSRPFGGPVITLHQDATQTRRCRGSEWLLASHVPVHRAADRERPDGRGAGRTAADEGQHHDCWTVPYDRDVWTLGREHRLSCRGIAPPCDWVGPEVVKAYFARFTDGRPTNDDGAAACSAAVRRDLRVPRPSQRPRRLASSSMRAWLLSDRQSRATRVLDVRSRGPRGRRRGWTCCESISARAGSRARVAADPHRRTSADPSGCPTRTYDAARDRSLRARSCTSTVADGSSATSRLARPRVSAARGRGSSSAWSRSHYRLEPPRIPFRRPSHDAVAACSGPSRLAVRDSRVAVGRRLGGRQPGCGGRARSSATRATAEFGRRSSC